MLKNYKLVITYDGSRYQGWQRQKSSPNTIQGKIENVLSILYSTNIEINGSGRTDAGAHAKNQVANYKAEDIYDCEYILNYLNSYLPDDIAVKEVLECDMRFHARLSAKRKTYEYRILNSCIPDVFRRKYLYKFEDKLDLEKMKESASLFLGTHDFLGFSSLKKTKKSTVRTIYSIDIEKLGDEIVFTYCGDGFLYNMVRIITGTLVDIGRGKSVDINAVLNGAPRSEAGITLPACGLCLINVEY